MRRTTNPYNLAQVEHDVIESCFAHNPGETYFALSLLLGVSSTKVTNLVASYAAEGEEWAQQAVKDRKGSGRPKSKNIMVKGSERHQRELAALKRLEDRSPFWNSEENHESFKPRNVVVPT